MQEEQISATNSTISGSSIKGEQSRSVGLTPLQERALEHLATGKSIAAAARSAGVGRRTIFRWLKSDPHFTAAYNAWRQETIASGRARCWR